MTTQIKPTANAATDTLMARLRSTQDGVSHEDRHIPSRAFLVQLYRASSAMLPPYEARTHEQDIVNAVARVRGMSDRVASRALTQAAYKLLGAPGRPAYESSLRDAMAQLQTEIDALHALSAVFQ